MQPTLNAFSVRDFGAVGDGETFDTAAIQKAIDQCAAMQGGTVYLPAGRYLTGTLVLKNNVSLQLAAQACLLGSTSLGDYPQMDGAGYCLIYARNAGHIRLCGEGAVDGQGAAFPYGTEGFDLDDESAAPSTKSFIRPLLIHLKECHDVSIAGVTLRHAASWCCHLEKCSEVHIDAVHLLNRANQNNDGFDLTDCEDVTASNCHVDCGDDAFALKEGGIRIAITNCLISTRWAAFRIGPEARGVFRDITVSNCVVYDTYGSGIKIQQVEGGVMEDILFNNIVMDNVTGPISMRLGGYLGWKKERKDSLPIGVLHNVRFSQIRARVAENANPLPHEVPAMPGERRSCINLTGVPGYTIDNVTFSGVDITFPGGGTLAESRAAVPELRDQYPEYHMFGQLPAYGMYVRHVKGLKLEDVRVGVQSTDLRPALVCEDVDDLELDGFRAEGDAGADALIVLRQARRVFIHGCRALKPVKAFVQAESSPDMLLEGNDLRLVDTPVHALPPA